MRTRTVNQNRRDAKPDEIATSRYQRAFFATPPLRRRFRRASAITLWPPAHGQRPRAAPPRVCLPLSARQCRRKRDLPWLAVVPPPDSKQSRLVVSTVQYRGRSHELSPSATTSLQFTSTRVHRSECLSAHGADVWLTVKVSAPALHAPIKWNLQNVIRSGHFSTRLNATRI